MLNLLKHAARAEAAHFDTPTIKLSVTQYADFFAL
jgi:hypothetical protein